jgi:tripartite-type tricarboxylate transporter receptor subunit TctC
MVELNRLPRRGSGGLNDNTRQIHFRRATAMKFTRVLAAIWVIALQLAGAGAAAAQQYPARPITLIVPFAPGGPVDTLARPVAASMAKALKQAVVIENVGGAGGNIGVARGAKAAPDGYTLLIHHMGMATSPALYKKLDFNPLNDFEYIGLVGDSTSMLLARRDFPARNLKEFVAYVKANKDKLSFASTGPAGGPPCALLFMNAIQTELLEVVFKSSALGMNELVAGRVDMMCDSVLTATPHIKAGKVKAIGATSKYRSSALPDVPTLDEQGLPGFELVNWMGIYAPRNTPRPVVDRLAAALQAALRDPELLAILERLHFKVAAPEQATPAGLAQRLKSEIARWGPILKNVAIQSN